MSNDYTKKVLEYFRNPHNMGRMENPDGIGKVGNPVCVREEDFLHTNNEIKEAKDIVLNDKVVGISGLYYRVGKIFSQNYKGYILAIRNRLGETQLTPEHVVLAKKVPLNKDKFRRTKGKQELPYCWYHAGELKKNDIVLYPIFKYIKNKDYIDLGIEKKRFDFRSKKLPFKIPLNAYFLRLCGYYLSEGSVKDKTSNRTLMFTFNINEKDLINDVIQIIKKLWDLKVCIDERKKVNTTHLIINNTFLERFFKKHFGDSAESKKIPDFLMNLSPKKQRHLIYGLWKGDGYVDLKQPRAGYSTISFQLISQLKLLLLRQKIIPSIYIEKEKIRKGVKHRKSYRIYVGDRESLKTLFNLLDVKHEFNSFVRRKVWVDDNFVYLPITAIKKKPYEGRIYNLEVPNAHSFITNSLCLHNCGDVMWIYIKVKDNVIVDSKFETFGCVAAIATSSILTDLVKGKTIEEALKVSNKDVVRELGGLPSVKMHCSLLAEEGIKAAIEDYRKKSKDTNPSKD